MINIGILISLFILFHFLGKATDLIISHIKIIGERFGVRIFFLGLLLGFLTSLPELTIGLNAIFKGVQGVSLGDLLGGFIVILGLILGLSLILNRKIVTDGKVASFLPILVYLSFPFILGLDNKFSRVDGAIMLAAYVFLVHHLYLQNRNEKSASIQVPKKIFLKELYKVILGALLIAVISNLIIRLTLVLIGNLDISIFALGAVLFAIGTNMPEVTITIRSWRKHIKELSISNLIGSAIANPAIIGIFALIKPIIFKTDLSFYFLMTFTFILFAFLLRFYETGKNFSRKEGMALAGIYFLFLASQILFLTII